jgi:uncharacterized protein YigE (DUF2233 family)
LRTIAREENADAARAAKFRYGPAPLNMKSIWAVLFWCTVSCCHAEWTLAQREVLAELPGGAQFVEADLRDGNRTARVRAVFFDTRQARFAVVDNTDGLGLGEAMKKIGALAGTNGAYFHPDRTPVGLMVAGGKQVHVFEKAKLLSGVFVVTKGRPRIVRSKQFTAAAADMEALQAGPFLVEEGKPVAGLNTARAARRTIVATDGAGRWALVNLSAVTLAEAGAILGTAKAWAGFSMKQALNLDGGSSTALWVSREPEPFYSREYVTVRNFLAVLPR